MAQLRIPCKSSKHMVHSRFIASGKQRDRWLSGVIELGKHEQQLAQCQWEPSGPSPFPIRHTPHSPQWNIPPGAICRNSLHSRQLYSANWTPQLLQLAEGSSSWAHSLQRTLDIDGRFNSPHSISRSSSWHLVQQRSLQAVGDRQPVARIVAAAAGCENISLGGVVRALARRRCVCFHFFWRGRGFWRWSLPLVPSRHSSQRSFHIFRGREFSMEDSTVCYTKESTSTSTKLLSVSRLIHAFYP